MIRLIVRAAKWLDSRFPEKVTVTAENYKALNEEIAVLRSQLKDNSLSLNTLINRLSVVESNAVHKEPVSIALKELDKLKSDYTSFKASMGFNKLGETNPEIAAMLNGQYLGGSESNG